MSYQNDTADITELDRLMSYRSERDIRTLNADQLLEMLPSYFPAMVSGFTINLPDLAQAGWWCRIVTNRFGGRVKITFFSKDGRSTISFRLSDRYRAYSSLEMFKLVSQGTMTVHPTIIPAQATDIELLEQVEQNIKSRLKKPRKKSLATVERIEKFAVSG